jgi:hypothetical protein
MENVVFHLESKLQILIDGHVGFKICVNVSRKYTIEEIWTRS